MSQDIQLQESVMIELGWEPSIDAARIDRHRTRGRRDPDWACPKLRTKGRGGEGDGSRERREGCGGANRGQAIS